MSTHNIVSSTEPSAYIKLTDEVRSHIMIHFDPENPGSKFEQQDPGTLLQHLLDTQPDAFLQSVPDADGRKRVRIVFPEVIGTCNVVPTEILTAEEQASIHRVQRGNKVVKVAASHRMFPTRECQLVLTTDNTLITVYPGEAAPPLPDTPDISDPYWDHHVFIEP